MRSWWRTGVVYQVYPASFADGNGDGIGDLAGLRTRLPYLRRLGIDGIWVTTWYLVPLSTPRRRLRHHRLLRDRPTVRHVGRRQGARRGGARPRSAGAHGRRREPHLERAPVVPGSARGGAGQRRALDVPLPGRPWTGGDEPPNDWISAFGGPAWTRVTDPDGRPGQWYLHLFDPGQPDLNWDDPRVTEAFEAVLRLWLDLGVDGLRVDAAPALAKRAGLPDHGFVPGDRFAPEGWHDSPLWDVDDVHEIYRGWRALTDAYDDGPGERVLGGVLGRVLVGEVPVDGAHRLVRHLRPDELHQAFTPVLIHTPWDAGALRAAVTTTFEAHAAVPAAPTWILSNHDEPRQVTRLGCPRATERGHQHAFHRDAERPLIDVTLGRRRARAAALFMLCLPGAAYLYQGEELGLADVDDLPEDALRDPMWTRSNGTLRGRDGCRVPLPWSGTAPPYGFTAGPGAPWLPQPLSWGPWTAEAQDGDPASTLSLYRVALARRRDLVSAAGDAFCETPHGVLAFDRGSAWRCVINLSGVSQPLGDGTLLIASEPLRGPSLPPDTAGWLIPPHSP